MTHEKRELTDEQITNIWHLCMAIDTAEFCQEFSRELIAADRALNADAGVMPNAVTEEMVIAYLTANDKYWRETDALPSKNPSRWRQGTPSEATRVSLEATLVAAPTPPAEQRGEQEPEPAYGYACRLAEALHKKHFRGIEHQHWRLLPDTLGVLTQIDNMVCGLVDPDSLAELRAKVEGLQTVHFVGVDEVLIRRNAVLAEIDKMLGEQR